MEEHASTGPISAGRSPVLATIWNVPNQLTIARLVLSIVCFIVLSFNFYLAGVDPVRDRGRHRLGRRLLGPALRSDHAARPNSRSVRRQDHHLRHVHLSGGGSVHR